MVLLGSYRVPLGTFRVTLGNYMDPLKPLTGIKLNVDRIKHRYLLYWYFQQNQYLNIKTHVVHSRAPIFIGPPGNWPACPCIKTALVTDYHNVIKLF